jgi:hypothetical protein
MKRKRLIMAVTGAVVVIAGGAATAAAMTGDDDGAGTANRRLPQTTGTVTLGDLVDTETVDGTLGYGDEHNLDGGASGTITWLPAKGATVKRGHTLYDLNGKPVTLMYGDVPVYRTLSNGVSDGDDVKQLERNLKDLGYDAGMTVDDEFTSATGDAVEEWQDDRGLPRTGEVDGSEVIFAPGPVRITGEPIDVGGRTAAGKPVLKVTDTERKVRVDLDTADQHMARTGAKVTVELPNNVTVSGKISKVGTVATAVSSGGNASPSPGQDATIEVDITLDHPSQVGKLDQAPVSVALESERHKNVLSVPVEALLALPGEDYGVQIVEGAGVRVVPVKTGLYAEGRVEVSAPGLTAGTKVGVPSK